MKAIKTVLTFLYGSFMASAIWIMILFPVGINDSEQTINGWVLPIIVIFVLCCLVILVGSIFWLAEHWDEK